MTPAEVENGRSSRNDQLMSKIPKQVKDTTPAAVISPRLLPGCFASSYHHDKLTYRSLDRALKDDVCCFFPLLHKQN